MKRIYIFGLPVTSLGALFLLIYATVTRTSNAGWQFLASFLLTLLTLLLIYLLVKSSFNSIGEGLKEISEEIEKARTPEKVVECRPDFTKDLKDPEKPIWTDEIEK